MCCRQPTGGDDGINLNYANKVAVHAFAGQAGYYTADKPQLQAQLGVGQEWADGITAALVRVK